MASFVLCIFSENHFKFELVTPLEGVSAPPPLLRPWPKLNRVSRVHFSMNNAVLFVDVDVVDVVVALLRMVVKRLLNHAT